jgi:MFS family permease
MALLGAAVFSFGYKSGANSGEGSFHAHGPSMPSRSAFSTPVVWSMVMLGLINMGGFSATFFVPSAVKSTFHLGALQSPYLISASYVVAIVINLPFGYLCDTFNRWGMMIGLAVTSLIIWDQKTVT